MKIIFICHSPYMYFEKIVLQYLFYFEKRISAQKLDLNISMLFTQTVTYPNSGGGGGVADEEVACTQGLKAEP